MYKVSKLDQKMSEIDRKRGINEQGVAKGYYLNEYGLVNDRFWDDGSVRILNKKIYEKGSLFLKGYEGVYWKYDSEGKKVPVAPIKSKFNPTIVKEIMPYGVYREGWTAPKGKDLYQKGLNGALRESLILCVLLILMT